MSHTPPPSPDYRTDLPPHDQRVAILWTATRRGTITRYWFESDGLYTVQRGDQLVQMSGAEVDRIAFDNYATS